MRTLLTHTALVYAFGCLLIASGSAQPIKTVHSFPDGQDVPYLGNGMIGYRIQPVPFMSWKAAASGYVRDAGDGSWETLGFAPYPFAMDFKLNDTPSMREQADDIEVTRQSLDMSCGELTTDLTFPMGGGKASATVLQFVSRTTPVITCQEIHLTIPVEGKLIVSNTIASGPGNENYSGMQPNHEKAVDMMIGLTPLHHRSKCGVTVKMDFSATPTRLDFEDESHLTRRWEMNVSAGQTVVIRGLAATVTSAYHPEPHLEASRLVNWADLIGFDMLRQRNRHAWADIWKSRVRVTGDPVAQEYLDCALYYTFSSMHPSVRTSMPPFGMSQVNNYFGHVFWDTDTYTTPTLILLSPETARATVMYRLRNLEAAKKRAAVYGFRGAMYPWESGTRGEEATPSMVDTGWAEQHVNMCVAIAAWQYQQAAGDLDHAHECTWPIVKAVAEWVTSRVSRTDRGYEIRDTMSAHEGLTLHNSCYVNGIAARVLRIAGECATLVGYEADSRWATIADELFVPTGPAPGESEIDGNIIYMHDAGWVEEGASVDMYMLGFPFDLPLERQLLDRTYRFFQTKHDPVLSMGVAFKIGAGAFLGDRAGQRELLDRALNEKWEPTWGMGREYSNASTTCFVTTQAGMLQTVLLAMTGLRFEPDNWTKYPACLPAGWERIECDRIWLRGEPYRLVAVNGEKARLIPAP